MTTPQRITRQMLRYQVARAENKCQRCRGDFGEPRLVGVHRLGTPRPWVRALLCEKCIASAGDDIAVLRLVPR